MSTIRGLHFSAVMVLILANVARGEEIFLAANETVIHEYREITKDKSCHQVDTFTGSHFSYRAVIEVILICKAFYLSPLKVDIKLVPMPNYTRALFQSKSQKFHMPAETIWSNEIDESLFYKSSPIIRRGEMEQGIYTMPDRKQVLNVTSLAELKKFSAVSQKNWKEDWAILQAIRPARLYSVSKIEALFKMTQTGRADFMFWSFSSEQDMRQTRYGVSLVPIPNVKISMPSSRHFILSKHKKNAKKLFVALESGINALRKLGAIHRAFEESGFFQTRVKDWAKLNPSMNPYSSKTPVKP